MFQVAEGLEWSAQALAREVASPQALQSRCHLYLGIGYNLQATNMHLKQERQILVNSALESFQKYEIRSNI